MSATARRPSRCSPPSRTVVTSITVRTSWPRKHRAAADLCACPQHDLLRPFCVHRPVDACHWPIGGFAIRRDLAPRRAICAPNLGAAHPLAWTFPICRMIKCGPLRRTSALRTSPCVTRPRCALERSPTPCRASMTPSATTYGEQLVPWTRSGHGAAAGLHPSCTAAALTASHVRQGKRERRGHGEGERPG